MIGIKQPNHQDYIGNEFTYYALTPYPYNTIINMMARQYSTKIWNKHDRSIVSYGSLLRVCDIMYTNKAFPKLNQLTVKLQYISLN